MNFDEWLMDRLTQSRTFSTILVSSECSGCPLKTWITPKISFWYATLSRFTLQPWNKSCMEGPNDLKTDVVFLVWDTYFKINIFDWSQICFAFVAELSSSFSLLLHGDKKCIGNKSRLLLANSLVNLWKKILYKVVWLFIISW